MCYIEVGGCAVRPVRDAAGHPLRHGRTRATPSSIARTDTPTKVRRILNAHGKHAGAARERHPGATRRVGVMGTPNAANTSTHEERAAGIFAESLTARIPAYQIERDWPPEKVSAVIAALDELGMDAFRPYPTSRFERQRVCGRKPPRFHAVSAHLRRPRQARRQGRRRAARADPLPARQQLRRHRVAKSRHLRHRALRAETIRATQRELGLNADGVWGANTDAAAVRRQQRSAEKPEGPASIHVCEMSTRCL